MDEVSKNNRKVVWYSIFAAITVILCYLFVVLYFFYISPLNISIKTKLWPFLSRSSLGQMYSDATVEIKWTYTGEGEELIEPIDMSVVGVNVRENGFIVAPYNDLRGCENSEIRIMTNSGKAYGGLLLFGDMNYDIAILKCVNLEGNAKIKIPYVNLGKQSDLDDEDIVAVSSPLERRNVWTDCELFSSDPMTAYSTFSLDEGSYSYNYSDGYTAVDYVLSTCYGVVLSDFTSGAFFDRSGKLLGLSNGAKLYGESEAGMPLDYECDVLIPVDTISSVLPDVVKAYEKGKTYVNPLVNSFVGIDQVETDCQIVTSSSEMGNENHIYVDNEWREIDDSILEFYENQQSPFGFYLLRDWAFNGAELSQGNVICGLKYRNKTYKINEKNDLFDVLYRMNEGETFSIEYVEKMGEEPKTLDVTVQFEGGTSEEI